jgi:hypothetical protein
MEQRSPFSVSLSMIEIISHAARDCALNRSINHSSVYTWYSQLTVLDSCVGSESVLRNYGPVHDGVQPFDRNNGFDRLFSDSFT